MRMKFTRLHLFEHFKATSNFFHCMQNMEKRSTSVEFVFDVACPYAFMASTQIGSIADASGADLVLTPVLLGGLYEVLSTSQLGFLLIPIEIGLNPQHLCM